MAATRILMSIWNGPFSLGPLTKPVAPMDVVMKVLEVAWKGSVIAIVGGSIVATGAIVVEEVADARSEARWAANRAEQDRQEAAARRRATTDLESISHQIAYRTRACPYSLGITLTNNGIREAYYFSWEIHYKERGRSNILIKDEGSSDYILKPGQSVEFCRDARISIFLPHQRQEEYLHEFHINYVRTR